MRSCCTRRDGEPMVRMIHADDEDDAQQHRRERRQESVRKAIERELQGEGLRNRGSRSQEAPSTASCAPYVRVQVEASQGAALDFVPPPPPYLSEATVPRQFSPADGLRDTSTSLIPTSSERPHPPSDGFRIPATPLTDELPDLPTWEPGPAASSSLPSGPQSVLPSRVSERIIRDTRDESTQTICDRGLDFQQLCELHFITTSSRTPGALHFFRNCHALRSTTAVQDRMICRYCLQAFRAG